MAQFLNKIHRHLANLPGWCTDRKIVVIESDDWGSIGVSDLAILERFRQKGIVPIDEDEARYIQNDTLASEDDLSRLFEVLQQVKDIHGNTAVFTAVAVVANPNFEKIKADDFQNYYYEPFTTSLERFGTGHNRSFELWKEGIQTGLFVPEFHGREHLNVSSWMRALKLGKTDTHWAFEQAFYGITDRKPINHVAYRAAFDIDEPTELTYLNEVISSGLNLFQQLFGYSASFFVPPNGPFNNTLEASLQKKGICYIGTSKIQREPIGSNQYKKHLHYIGQSNKYKQIYLTRNCFFEPNSNLKKNWVASCLDDVSIAFQWKKPAVVSSHRCNYIGYLYPENQKKGLQQLTTLLQQIKKRWPKVEFMTSTQLGDLIAKGSQ